MSAYRKKRRNFNWWLCVCVNGRWNLLLIRASPKRPSLPPSAQAVSARFWKGRFPSSVSPPPSLGALQTSSWGQIERKESNVRWHFVADQRKRAICSEQLASLAHFLFPALPAPLRPARAEPAELNCQCTTAATKKNLNTHWFKDQDRQGLRRPRPRPPAGKTSP